jgi:IS605 OrfB family transposase
MGRSKGVTISVKVPINWEIMTKKKQQHLKQIVGRDSRIIRSFLGIIEQHESELLTGRNKNRIHSSKLNELTLTALQVKVGMDQREFVEHDFKHIFPRISVNELQECRITATGMYESYLQLRGKKWRNVSKPCKVNRRYRIPRWIFSQRFSLVKQSTSIAKWWLNLRDSLDSAPAGMRVHNRILIPLKMSPFHLTQIRRGDMKALQIFTDREGKWWSTFAIRIPDKQPTSGPNLPPAVLGIDLGIAKAACATIVTPEKVRETRYFVQKDKVESIKRYDRLVARLQYEMTTRRNMRFKYDKVSRKLRKLRTKRKNIAREYDRVLVRQIVNYVSELSKSYDLYVSIGRLKYIRNIARRNKGTSKNLRSEIHSWAFARITKSLKHQLSQIGFFTDGKHSRFKVVPEAWTSIICWKCGKKGNRPTQNHFVCPTCGHRTNADRNGSINIAGRLITLTKSLHSVRGLGKWARAIARSARLKARGKTRSSRGKSLLSSKGRISNLGESAVVHRTQTSLLDFNDEISMDDNDPAVEKAVETLSVVETDNSTSRQEKETRSVGGISSQ